MAIITLADLAEIKTMLNGFELPKDLSAFAITELHDAKNYLKVFLQNQDEPQEAVTAALERFFRIRTLVNPENNNTAIDSIRAYLCTKKVLAQETPSTEEQVSAAMLKEIFTKNSLDLQKKKSTTKEMELEDLNTCYYQFTSDAKTSLEKLYEYTEKNPTKNYLDEKRPLIHVAIECDATGLLQKLVARIGDKKNPALECQNGTFRNETPLRFAAKLNKDEAIGLLIVAGADVNPAGIFFSTALRIRGNSIQRWAVENKRLDIIKVLAEKNQIDFDERYSDDNNILHIIAENDWHEVAEKISIQRPHIEHNNNKNGSPVILAIEHRHVNTALALLRNFKKDKAFLESKNIPHFMAATGWLEGVQLCIDAGVDINAAQSGGGLRMLTAAICGESVQQNDSTEQQNIVKLLLAQPTIKNTLNMVDTTGTPLGSAITFNCPNIAALLVAHQGINLDEKFEGKTIVQVAEDKAKTIPDWNKVIHALNQKNPLPVVAAPTSTSTEQMIVNVHPKIPSMAHQPLEQEDLIKEQKNTALPNRSTSVATVTAFLRRPGNATVIDNTPKPITDKAATTVFNPSSNPGVTPRQNYYHRQ